MEFEGEGKPTSGKGMRSVGKSLGVAEPAVWAVLNVETQGFGFPPDRRPQIPFERQVFSRLAGGQFDHGNRDIGDENRDGYAGGAAEYARLHKAMGLDSDAAPASASWGIGQVMGFKDEVAGYETVAAMVGDMVKDEAAQWVAMARFIANERLSTALARNDWTAFARGDNGKDFRRNDHDARVAAAHAKCTTLLPDLNLRTAQAALTYLGMSPGPIDGLRGRLARSALIPFQQKHKLAATGELDKATKSRLLAAAWPK